MADSILRLKVESQEYDAKLKRATQGLLQMEQECRKAGKSMNDMEAGNRQFVQSLGSMGTVSTTVRGKIGELSSSFISLRSQYNRLTEEEKKGDFGHALNASLEQLKRRVAEAKQELQEIKIELNDVGSSGGGGMFSGGKLSGMLQVFGGNLMTKGAGMLAGLASEMGDVVKQGIELAKQGEGIRNAFERLGRGDILDGLRQATHGTVTDIELMKAAVKFNDFKLPLDELGTMLAFAQQKAKDTGQSVDYMVDSIVTGLGRKSLMILDNLGLSASEIKDKMAETGDMTKAVGAIIREQMAKSGDYVETAADRAAQANVSLQNKMEELGRKFAPLQEASSNFWTSMKIGILDVVGGPLAKLLNGLTEAGRMMNAYNKMGGSGKVGRMTANLAGASEGNRQNIYQQQQEKFWRYINPREQQIKDIRAWQSGQRGEALQGRIGAIRDQYGSLDATKIQAEVDAAKKMLSEYQKAAKQILQPIKGTGTTTPTLPTATTTSTTNGETKQERATAKYEQAEKDYQQAVEQAALEMRAGTITQTDARRKELQAKESLWRAIGDAREIYDTPELEAAQKKAADEVVRLGGEVKLLSDAETQAKETAKQLATAQKNLADAQQQMADAQASGDLKGFRDASRKASLAQEDITRLTQVVDVQPGNVNLPEIPKEVVQKVNMIMAVNGNEGGAEGASVGANFVRQIQQDMLEEAQNLDMTAVTEIVRTGLKYGIDGMDDLSTEMLGKIFGGGEISDEQMQAYVDQVNEKLKAKFDETKWPEVLIKFNVDDKSIVSATNVQMRAADATAKAWQSTTQAVAQLGNALSNLEDPGAKAIGIILTAIANIALGFSAASAQAATLGPFGWIAWLGAGIAALTTTISTVHTLTGLANGGIVDGRSGGFVGGMSYSGDNVGNVRLDSGELVLNRSQQTNLANALSNPMQNLQLSTRISAEDIEVVLNNRFSRSGYGEMLTSSDYY